MPRGEILVAGSLAQRPGYGGHAWVFLQYLLGFRRLDWNVTFVDRLEPGMCVDHRGAPCPLERSANLAYLVAVMREFGLQDDVALLYDRGRDVIGLPLDQLLDRARRSALLLNVMGYLDDEAVLGAASRRVLLDIDPGFGQMWQALGLHQLFRDHDDYVTIGQNISRPNCAVPDCGIGWITTRPPVVLDQWPARPGGDKGFTSVATWRGPFAPVIYQGVTYGLRVHEQRRFADLPRRTGQRFELALDIDEADASDLELLRSGGWSLVPPPTVAGTPSAYRGYIQSSTAEFLVAKQMYVRARTGWVSDRSACYLSTGRPVVAQDTGLAEIIPTGEGLLTYTTAEEAAAAVDEVCGDYGRHARAARSLAEDWFDSDKVLGRLLAELRIG